MQKPNCKTVYPQDVIMREAPRKQNLHAVRGGESEYCSGQPLHAHSIHYFSGKIK
jgi:hypothetical protein